MIVWLSSKLSVNADRKLDKCTNAQVSVALVLGDVFLAKLQSRRGYAIPQRTLQRSWGMHRSTRINLCNAELEYLLKIGS